MDQFCKVTIICWYQSGSFCPLCTLITCFRLGFVVLSLRFLASFPLSKLHKQQYVGGPPLADGAWLSAKVLWISDVNISFVTANSVIFSDLYLVLISMS